MSVERPQFDVERSAPAPRGAVFLSYASQDAEAAKKICDALRAAGVEVWFDVEGGLETGDEWDAKIRRQIKECVLFIPIISANTQAREEGYFRIEWDLAAERARGIASGVPFILPVVIDDTREPEALVPDRFRSVQWTRASGGELPPATLAKLAKLWSHRAGLAKHQQASGASAVAEPSEEGTGRPRPVAPRNARSTLAWTLRAGGMVVAAGAAVWFLGFRQSADSAPGAAPSAAPLVVSSAADYPRNPDLKRARALLFTTDAIPEDFALAEDIIKPIVAQRPNDPEVAAVAAEVALEFLIRGFDLTPQRRSQVQRLTERAAQLAPENPYAVAAVGRYLLFIDAQLGRAEELTRRAIALRPDEARFHRTLYTILSRTRPASEVNAFGERMAALFPRDALVAYDIARRYKDENDIVEAEKWFDRTLSHEAPPAFAFVWKSWIMLQVHGDLAAAKAWLDRVPERQRANTRVANARYIQALFSGDTPHALRALGEVPDEWLTDFDFTGPKSLLIGNLHLRNGRADLAKVELEAALALTNAEIDKNPTDLFPRRAKMWALISLGRLEEARPLYQLLLQATRRPYVLNLRNLSWTNTVTSSLLLGYRDDAVTLLREAAAADANTRLVLRAMFKLDPRLAPWREDVEIVTILAEPDSWPTPASAAAAPGAIPKDKSVAVLPFANLSDDKDNSSFFADGVQEDVLTNLGGVRDLRVISRTSVAQYRNTTKSIRQIGEELRAAYVLEGSVRRAGNKVRVSGQLIRAATDEQVWAKAYDRDLTDIFAVQAELAQDIARALRAALSPQERATLVRRPTENVAAYEAYLKAREWRDKNFGSGRLLAAIAQLEKAVALDPKFALAWAELGDCHARLAFEEWDRSPARLAAARTAIDAAVRLAPDDPAVIARLGSYFLHSERDYPRASEQYLRLVALRPNDPEILRALGKIQIRQGRWADGIASLQRARELDPGDMGEARHLVTNLVDVRRYVEAEALARELAAAHPQQHDFHFWVAATAFMARGATADSEAFARQVFDPDSRDAVLYLHRVLARFRGDTRDAIRLDRESPYWEGGEGRWAQEAAAVVTLANAGDPTMATRARAVLATMQAESEQQPGNSWLFAWMGVAHALLGEKEQALAHARHAREILPESRDAVYGVENAVMLAAVYAWVGEKDQAIAEFARLLQVPHGTNIFTARHGSSSRNVQVSFKPLFDDPRFQALIADPKNNEPLF